MWRAAHSSGGSSGAERPAGTAMINSLGVDPSAQGWGTGRALVEAFLAEAGRRGAMRVDLTTDKVDNEVAKVFSRGSGSAWRARSSPPPPRDACSTSPS